MSKQLLSVLTDLHSALLSVRDEISNAKTKDSHPDLQLGFQAPAKPRYVYVGADDGGKYGWYFVENEERQPIYDFSLVGRITDVALKLITNPTHGDSEKLLVSMSADRPIVLVSGSETEFSKSLLGGLVKCTAEELARPVRVDIRLGDKKVVFASVYDASTNDRFEYIKMLPKHVEHAVAKLRDRMGLPAVEDKPGLHRSLSAPAVDENRV